MEYLPLVKELKAQTDIAKKRYQKLNDPYELDKIIKKEKATLKRFDKSNLICDSNYNLFKYYCDIKKFDSLSFKSKYFFLISFFNDLD